ncbi:MAG: type II secretion system protein N [Geobacteraceae bacterium]|nr:type II secretion system protein N [Geobacteraceae bacterium]
MDKKIVILNIIVSILILVVIAMIASDVIAYKLSRTFPTSLKKESTFSPTVRRNDLSAFSAILEKGLFGKATQGRLTPIAQAEGPAATSPNDLTLLGTAIGSFRETFAFILRQSTHEEKVFRLGEDVFDIGPLVSVRREGVEIQSGDSRIKLLAPTEVPGETAGVPVSPPQNGSLASKVSPGSYIIDQRALNAALDNIGQAMTDARLLPNSADGKVEGFNVSEVKPGGLFAMVGINNGDTLLSINDFALDSPEKAMQTLVSLKGQNRIKLDLIRDGRPTTFTYDIR